MSINKINIIFFLIKSRINKLGKCSLICRITYLKKRKEFTTGISTKPKYWNSKNQKVLTEAENHEFTNTQLGLIKAKINQAFLLLQVQGTDFTVGDIYTHYRGEKLREAYNVIEYFECYLKSLWV